MVQCLARCNPYGIDTHDRNQRPFLYVTYINKYDSPYTDENDEGSNTEDEHNASFPPTDDTSLPAGVTDAYICNLEKNTGLHNDDDNNSEVNKSDMDRDGGNRKWMPW